MEAVSVAVTLPAVLLSAKSIKQHGWGHPLLLPNLAFLIFVVPKYLTMAVTSNLTGPYELEISPARAAQAYLIISAAILTINLGFYLSSHENSPFTKPPKPALSVERIATASWLVAIPVFVVALVIVVPAYNIGLDSMFGKREILGDSGEVDIVPYLALKSTALIRVPGYLMIMHLASSGSGRSYNEKAVRWLVTSMFLNGALQLVFSQRSGLLLMVMDFAVIWSLYSPIPIRSLRRWLPALAMFNFATLILRTGSTNIVAVLELTFGRLYFFDVLKIAGILEFSQPSSEQSLVSWLTANKTRSLSGEGRIHHMIGEEVFGTTSGVPPTFIGESILRWGTVSVLPAALLVGLSIGVALRRARNSRTGVRALVWVLVANRIAYFASNSDASGMLLRVLLDCGAVVGFVVAAQLFPLPQAKGTIRRSFEAGTPNMQSTTRG